MKKMITLLLVLTGMVCTASATDYIISGKSDITNGTHEWWWQDSDNLLSETTTSGIYTLVVENCSLAGDTEYGFKVKVNENAWNNDTTFPASEYSIKVPTTGTYNLIYYVDIANQSIRVIALPMIRWNITDNWSETYNTERNFTKKDDFTFTYEVDADDFTGDFSFRLFSAIFSKQAYPGGQDLTVTYGGSIVSSAYFNDGSTDWSWRLTKPAYTFEKVVITAVYKPFDTTNSVDFGQWDVKADAYVSKTITAANEYATLGCSVPLDITSLPAGVTAYTVTADASTKKISKAEKTTALAANEGVLLQNASGKDVTLSIPVAAEASASASNGMVAFTGSGNLTQPGSDYTYYILANQNDHVGFYKVNTTYGNEMGANTAYLRVNGTVAARDFYWFDDEATGITSTAMQPGIGQYYDLQGRRVAQPAKGLYIVNGKKIILK